MVRLFQREELLHWLATDAVEPALGRSTSVLSDGTWQTCHPLKRTLRPNTPPLRRMIGHQRSGLAQSRLTIFDPGRGQIECAWRGGAAAASSDPQHSIFADRASAAIDTTSAPYRRRCCRRRPCRQHWPAQRSDAIHQRQPLAHPRPKSRLDPDRRRAAQPRLTDERLAPAAIPASINSTPPLRDPQSATSLWEDVLLPCRSLPASWSRRGSAFCSCLAPS